MLPPIYYARYWVNGPKLWDSQASVFYGRYGQPSYCEWIIPGTVGENASCSLNN